MSVTSGFLSYNLTEVVMTEEELLHRHRLKKLPSSCPRRGSPYMAKLTPTCSIDPLIKYFDSNCFGCQDSCRETKSSVLRGVFGVAGNILY